MRGLSVRLWRLEASLQRKTVGAGWIRTYQVREQTDRDLEEGPGVVVRVGWAPHCPHREVDREGPGEASKPQKPELARWGLTQ